MKNQLLIEVPKDSPTRKQKLNAFKKAFGIWTHYAAHMPPDERWIALNVSTARKFWNEPDMSPWDLISNYCRVLEEQGLLEEGKSERDAIAKICANRGIPFWR